MTRPRAAPILLSELTRQAPARVIKKLDQSPRVADAWKWSSKADVVTVESDTGETVTLEAENGVVPSVERARCSCLLAPRCFHLLAVVSVLEPSDEPALEPAPTATVASRKADASGLHAAQREAALALWRAGADALEAGAKGAGQVLQAELLRAVHSCRAVGLARLASAGLRVVRSIRDLHADRPEFSLPILAADLGSLLEVSHAISTTTGDELSRELVGVARRSYEDVGSLRLFGLFTEAVIAGSGYAGVVTHLADDTGRLWSVSAVEPGDPSRVVAAYQGPAGLGDAVLAHRALARQGLYVQNATGSADRRLGSGAGVRAVAAGPSSWSDAALARLWEAPLGEQLARALAAQETPPGERPADANLVFFRGRVRGSERDALVVEVAGPDESFIRAIAASDHPALATHDNLRLLAHAPGFAIRAIARPHAARAATVVLHAFAADANDDAKAPALRLPEEWGGRVNVALDRLQRSFFTGLEKRPVELARAAAEVPDALEPLRRRLHRLALGGRTTVTPESISELERDASLLDRRLLATGALVLRGLGLAAVGAARTMSGTRAAGDATSLARAFVACASYERGARRAFLLSTFS